MKTEQIKTFATKLIEEASLLQQRVKEYYNDENDELALFLRGIAEDLENLDREKLRGDRVGIYRVVSDAPTLEKSELGKDLYAFNGRLKELIAMLE
ncbi:MAG: hypothetical protein ACOYYI_06565 [Chloroflexota bacterium]